MKIVVLLSAGLHPVSGRPHLPKLEAQAIALAHRTAEGLDAEIVGLHAGPEGGLPADAFGHGLSRILHRVVPQGLDPVPALIEALREARADLVVAGRRGEGGEDTGLVPYALAEALGLPLVPDIVAVDRLDPAQATARLEHVAAGGTRRRFTRLLPVLATVHPRAGEPLPFAFAQMRRGVVERAAATGAAPEAGFEERPYRARPKLMRSTGTATAGQVVVSPGPEEAARLILDHIERLGIRDYRTGGG